VTESPISCRTFILFDQFTFIMSQVHPQHTECVFSLYLLSSRNKLTPKMFIFQEIIIIIFSGNEENLHFYFIYFSIVSIFKRKHNCLIKVDIVTSYHFDESEKQHHPLQPLRWRQTAECWEIAGALAWRVRSTYGMKFHIAIYGVCLECTGFDEVRSTYGISRMGKDSFIYGDLAV